MATRFISTNATPPTGYYEYGIDGDTVNARDIVAITRLARDLRAKHGLPPATNPFRYVMEYMCRFLPNGFCTEPSSTKALRGPEVKENTRRLFKMRLEPSDVIEKRMVICSSCPKHTRRGFCVDCTGLLEWIYRGFGTRRPQLPADRALGVCVCDEVLAAAGASVAGRPLTEGAEYPEGCWRVEGGVSGG